MRYTTGMDIRQTILDRMKRLGMNQAKLADLTGISRPRLNAYLRGHCDIYAKTLARVFDALELDIRPARRKKGR